MLIAIDRSTSPARVRAIADDAAARVVPAALLREQGARLFQNNERIAIRLEADESLEPLKDHLAKIARIDIAFPAFTDGRPFSKAFRLRRYLRFSGGVRAVGQVLPDQIFFLSRAGFDSIEVPGPLDADFLHYLANKFSGAYQPGADGRGGVRNPTGDGAFEHD